MAKKDKKEQEKVEQIQEVKEVKKLKSFLFHLKGHLKPIVVQAQTPEEAQEKLKELLSNNQ